MKDMPIATAALSWQDADGQMHLRVYSSDGYTVTERREDGTGWTDGSFSEPGSAVSATCWYMSDGVHIRVYCTFQDHTTEWIRNPATGWAKGSYTVV